MNEKESYQNIIAELKDSLQGLEDKLSSHFKLVQNRLSSS